MARTSYLRHFVMVSILESEVAPPWNFPAYYEKDYEPRLFLIIIQQLISLFNQEMPR